MYKTSNLLGGVAVVLGIVMCCAFNQIIGGTSPTNEHLGQPKHYRINFKKTLDYRINSSYSIKTYMFVFS